MATPNAGNGALDHLPPSPKRTVPRQPSGLITPEQLRELVAAGLIDTVMFALPDLQGRLKGKRYSARHFLERVIPGGADMCAYVLATDVDMTPVDNFALASWETGYQDLVAVPDLATLRTVPWVRGAAVVLGDAVTPEDQPIEVAPRHILQRQLERLSAHGLQVKVGLETEFVVYRGTGTYEQASAGGDQGRMPMAEENLDYALDHAPEVDRFFHRLQAALTGAGLPVEAIKTEGAPGQVEVTFQYGDPVAACDGHLLFKHAVRAVGRRCSLAPTFMAAPETGIGSGLHLHMSLWRDGASAITGPDGRLSDLAEHAIAGMLDALPSFGPLYAPNVNSYKRFTPKSFAPTAFTWGVDNRSCAIRVVGHGEGRHLELRVPGADANPYLALAAALAGINYGIAHQLKSGLAESGNAYACANGAMPVASTLQQALVSFRHSPTVLDAVGPDVVAHYAHLAQLELNHHQQLVTDAERQRWLTRA
ncbi:glutamine synthetase family protein [Streptomyces sp. NBC_01381]|uniref:glutamine synthetase family protein n=1 Tax=Streptomyces sp. NBC_01381 TaxID=2903845 RepID=UPI002255FB14|nr:glutamine synthetase family protein [Streptomyces sp. NBC_01381]MCX4666475.1 glutamine synthetase family protein [Streptomyces sp. NBC_01381]